MTSARRLFTAGGVALLSLLLVAPPAPAAEEPTVEWTRPTSGDVYLRGPSTLTGTVNGPGDSNKISKLKFALEAVDGEGPEGCRATIPNDEQVIEPPDELPYKFELPIDVPCNRRYKVTATITRAGALESGVCLPPDTDCTNTTDPFEFAVAIKPAKITGLAATPYDPATKAVKLTWNPDPMPADFLRYEVRIDPPGEGAANAKILFAEDGPSFDYTVADSDQGPHNFLVRAVREGPDDTGDDAIVFGPASDNVQAGPEAPPGAPPAEAPGTGFSGPGPATGGKAPKPKTRTTVDTGFNKNLPFDPSQTTTVPPTSSTAAPPPEDAAVLAIDDNRDQDTRRATVVPIAGGLVLLMGAAHLRLLSKRAEEPEIPIRSR